MPHPITIDLSIVVSVRDGVTLARAIGFPDISVAASTSEMARSLLRRRIQSYCRKLVASELVSHLTRGEVAKETFEVSFTPEIRSQAWRTPITIAWDGFVWKNSETITLVYLPSLEISVIATVETDLEKLVCEQIRSAVRRRNAWSLAGLIQMQSNSKIVIEKERVELSLMTATEYLRKQKTKPQSKTPTLRAVASRLAAPLLPIAYHRDKEVAELARLLSSDAPRSVLLVGPSGVGKTAVFHQWVRQRSEFSSVERVNAKSVTCWATDGSRLISGQSGFGMWQRQCLQMADEAHRFPSVIHLGNLVELCESGRIRGSGGCGALLASRLADGSFKGVIECTDEQLTRIERIEPRLVSALTVLRIEEPSPEQTRAILLESAANWKPINVTEELKRKAIAKKKKRSRSSRASNFGTSGHSHSKELPTVEPESLVVLDRLHRRFQTDAAAPGRPLSFFHAVMSELKSSQTLDESKVIEAFGRQTGLPRFLIDDSVRPDLHAIQTQLQSQVMGQTSVIEALVDVMATLAVDLSRGDRPLASLMLIGPTGVGKTETAKALARLVYSDVSRLVRIDMSELSTPSAVGRLVGGPSHPEGILTSAVRAQPFSLVLLDEFEKAHPSVFDLLLGVLGEGRLTDARGRLADFRNTIILMTSNLGVDSFHDVPLGLADTQKSDRYHAHFERQIREFLRPEMFNRIDRILTFHPLDKSTVARIAAMRMEEVQHRDGWQPSGHRLQVESPAILKLAHDGYEPIYGARPLAREIERRVVVPLSNLICHSGRQSRLIANVSIQETEKQGPRVHVTGNAAPISNPKKSLSIQHCVDKMTTLRRRSQAFDRCDAMRQRRQQFTMADRKLKMLLRGVKDPNKRAKIRSGSISQKRTFIEKQLLAAGELCSNIENAETRLLANHYRGETIDIESVIAETDFYREQLWTMLCDLQRTESSEADRITLIATGSNLSMLPELYRRYLAFAGGRGWNIQVHALLALGKERNQKWSSKKENTEGHDRRFQSEGWNDEPAFRVHSISEADRIIAESLGVSGGGKPTLAAYRMIHSLGMNELPKGTLGLMMTFRGSRACLIMSGEVGIHTFEYRDSTSPKPTVDIICMQSFGGMPIQYVAPDWLPHREFQAQGSPRRTYNFYERMIYEFVAGETLKSKMDREGRWLAPLLLEETERRVWSMLDES